MGETGYRSTMAAILAEPLAALGRFDEALRYSEVSERAAGVTDLAAQWGWRHARAQALLGLDRPDEALLLAAAALELVDGSDQICEQAAVRRTLARAYAARGESADASRLLGEAIDRYRQKGVPVEVERTREILASL